MVIQYLHIVLPFKVIANQWLYFPMPYNVAHCWFILYIAVFNLIIPYPYSATLPFFSPNLYL